MLPGEVLVVGTNGTTGSSSRCDTAIRAHPTRQITTVLMAGYDTNRCIVDKPCGAVGLSTELAGMAEVLLVRDVTRGQYTTVENPWYGHLASINMLELGWWLSSGITHPDIANTAGSPAPRPDHAQQQTDPTPRRGLRSLELSDLLAGLGMPAAAAALQPLRYPVPAANQSLEQPNPVPSGAAGTGAALVVVSCSGDYHNDGFRARVMENRATVLEPLLAAVRSVSTATIIHVPNGHTPDGACVPLPGELVATSTATFDALVKANSIGTLLYAGYGANTDVLFGDGGMARYYSAARYLGEAVPAYGWVQGATIAVETPDTLGDRWAEKLAVAYRNAPVVVCLRNPPCPPIATSTNHFLPLTWALLCWLYPPWNATLFLAAMLLHIVFLTHSPQKSPLDPIGRGFCRVLWGAICWSRLLPPPWASSLRLVRRRGGRHSDRWNLRTFDARPCCRHTLAHGLGG